MTQEDLKDSIDRRDVLVITLAKCISERDRLSIYAELDVLTMLSMIPPQLAPGRSHPPMC